MVCFRYIIVNTLHKGDKNYNNSNSNNNNNNNTGLDVDRSLPSGVEDKNEWSFKSSPPIQLNVVVRDFTFS